MKRLVLLDLDDTLFQTRRKEPTACHVAALDANGAPRSFQTDRQRALFAWLTEGARVVAVTGRTVEAFRRVRLPLGPEAICSFGGVILTDDGHPDPAWRARLAPLAAAAAPVLEELAAALPALAAACGASLRWRLAWDDGLPLYLTMRRTDDGEPPAPLAAALQERLAPDWTLHATQTTLAVLPPFLDKRHAVAYWLERHRADGPWLTLAAGDSLTDLGFMSLCDVALTPRGSQIQTLPWRGGGAS